MRERIRAGHNHNFSHPDESSGQSIDPRTLSKAVDAILPADRVVASDPGQFCGWVPRYLRVPLYLNPYYFLTMGFGVAANISREEWLICLAVYASIAVTFVALTWRAIENGGEQL